MTHQETASSAALKNIVSGTCGGVAIVAVGHPFDTVKVRLQCQKSILLPGDKPLYTGAWHCVTKTFKQEGVMGLYKGAAFPLVGQMLFRAALFFSHGEWKRVVGGGQVGANLSLAQHVIAGSLTGVTVSVVESPIDMFKSKMQVQRFQEEVARSKGEKFTGYTTSRQCFFDIVKRYGLRGVYQGWQGTIIRNSLANGFFFATYEMSKGFMTSKGQSPSSSTLFVCGGVSAVAYWLIPYPLDVVKSGLMSDHVTKSHRQYTGWIDCVKKLYAQGGIPRFYLGLAPCLLRAIPANTAMVLTLETVKQWMSKVM